MANIGIIVARFQTPALHPGHIELVRQVQARHRNIAIVLGVAAVRASRRNPLDFHTRERMLRAAFPEVMVLPLADHPSDAAWSLGLDELLTRTFPGDGLTLYGSRDSFLQYYAGALPTEALPATAPYSATDLRTEAGDRVRDTEDFRAGIIYAAYNQWPRALPCVDVAIVQSGRLLLGAKAGQDGWRLPGGFVSPTDDSYEAAAHREALEECGDLALGPLRYLGSFRVDDWRYRSETDKILTTLFQAELLEGHPTPGDDLAQLRWVPLAEIPALLAMQEIVPAHRPLIGHLLQPTASLC